jgi:hypothetical protein
MPATRTMPLDRKNASKSRTQVRKVVIGKGRVAVTLYLHKKDAIKLAKEIQAEWPTKFRSS